MEDKLHTALDLISAGNKFEALRLLAQTLRDDPKNERAWVAMAEIQADPRKKKQCLEKLLSLNPENPEANRMMIELEVAPEITEQEEGLDWQNPLPTIEQAMGDTSVPLVEDRNIPKEQSPQPNLGDSYFNIESGIPSNPSLINKMPTQAAQQGLQLQSKGRFQAANRVLKKMLPWQVVFLSVLAILTMITIAAGAYLLFTTLF